MSYQEEGQVRLKRLKESFEFAQKYERENPSNFRQIIANYEQVRRDGLGTKYRLMATARLLAARERRMEAAESGFLALKEQAEALARGLEFSKAVERLDTWLAEHRGLGFEARINALRRKINERAEAEAKGLMAKVTSAVHDEEFAKARRILAQMRQFGVPAAIELAGQGEAELAKALKEAEARWRIEAVAKHVEVLREVHQATTWRRYEDAAKLVTKALRDPKLKSIRTDLRKDLQDVRTAQQVEQMALKALQEGKATNLRIKGIRYEFKALKGDWVICKGLGDREVTEPVAEIKIKELARLAEVGLKPLDESDHLKILVFYMYTGALREARLEIANLERSGVEVPDRLTARFELFQGGWEHAERETRAVQILMRLRASYRARQWEDAHRELINLEDYKETAAYKEAAEEIQRIREETDLHLPGTKAENTARGQDEDAKPFTERMPVTDDVPDREVRRRD